MWLLTRSEIGHHEEVMTWIHFPHYWPFVRGIHQSMAVSLHKGPINADLWCFFDVKLNKMLNKHSSHWWFELPWGSCDVIAMAWYFFIQWWQHRYPLSRYIGSGVCQFILRTNNRVYLDSIHYTGDNYSWVNSLGLRQNGDNFANDISKYILFIENVLYCYSKSTEINLKCPVDNKSALI